MPSLLHRQGMAVRSSGVRLHWSVDSGNTAAATEASMYDAQHFFSTEKKSCPNTFLSNTTKRSQHIFFLTSQRAAFIIHDFYQT